LVVVVDQGVPIIVVDEGNYIMFHDLDDKETLPELEERPIAVLLGDSTPPHCVSYKTKVGVANTANNGNNDHGTCTNTTTTTASNL
jgi:hypothetical protein